MNKLGLVFGMKTFVPFLLALLVAQWVPYVWVRIVVALAAAQTYIVYHFPLPGIGHSLMGVLHEELLQARVLLRTGHLVEPFQTHLFLLALASIYWLLTYASQRPKLWLFYNGLGILVLAIIDGNTNVHPNLAIVVNSLITVFVLGLSRYAQLRLHFEQFSRPAMRYIGPLLSVIVLASGAAWLLPKAPAAWADPFANFGGGTGGSGTGTGSGHSQTIGYQESNSRLGGSFVMNYTPVLEVDSSVPLYLRGKVYSDYTGKGWIAGHAIYHGVQGGKVTVDSNTMLTPAAPTKKVTQTIHVLSNRLAGDTVFGAYSIASLKPAAGENPMGLQVNMQNGDVVGGYDRNGYSYTVISKAIEDPSSNLAALPSLPTSISARTKLFATTVGNQYLQLPSELPARVKNLAQKIVTGDTKEYDMVTAIENYLQGYQYQTSNIPVPGKNQDYVDQFLFESQVGYCNNFSSSLAVLLRTVGIPTRWVTGFADGQEVQNSTSPGINRYMVRESDAHSWVEVYFPKYGWIPFDPTPGFTFHYLANPHPVGSTTTPPATTPTPPTSHPKTGKTPQSTGTSGVLGAIPWQAIWTWTWKFLAAVGAAVVVAGLLFRKRVLLRVYLWLWKQDTPRALTRSMIKLLALLRRKGWLGERAATMRDLEPAAVKSGIDQADFHRLRTTVERTWYSMEQPTATELQNAHKTWVQWLRAVIFGKPAKKHRRTKTDD